MIIGKIDNAEEVHFRQKHFGQSFSPFELLGRETYVFCSVFIIVFVGCVNVFIVAGQNGYAACIFGLHLLVHDSFRIQVTENLLGINQNGRRVITWKAFSALSCLKEQEKPTSLFSYCDSNEWKSYTIDFLLLEFGDKFEHYRVLALIAWYSSHLQNYQRNLCSL